MVEGKRSSEMREPKRHLEFDHAVLSWSLEDIFNEDLYKNQVEKIPASFSSTEQYFGSYRLPLLEETRAAMRLSIEKLDRAPYAEVTKLQGTSLFDVNVDCWRNRYSEGLEEPYKTLPGDVCVIADAKPETAYDLQRAGRTWTFALVTSISGDDDKENISFTSFKVKALKDILFKEERQKPLFVVFLMNISSNKRIWNALHLNGNLKIIKQVLCNVGQMVESCSICSSQSDGTWNESFSTSSLNQLNESQSKAVLACLNKVQCNHKSHVELIWGPPGTGKTKTTGVLLLTLLRMKHRALTCAPTDTAITEVAACVVKLVKEDKKIGCVEDGRFCSLGDILLFGTEERFNVNSETQEIFLDYRVERLTECFGPLGWLHCFNSMITFLEDCVSDYHTLSRKYGKGKCKSFLEFAREGFTSTASPLRRCVLILTTHISKINFREHDFQDFETLFWLLDSFESGLFLDGIVSEEVEQLFLPQHSEDDKLFSRNFTTKSLRLCAVRSQCLSVLKTVRDSLGKLKLPPRPGNKDSILKFCFQMASSLFCTAYGSYELYDIVMKPPNVLVIDEAAQLKECESAIPLQLLGISNSILIGDELQLPATVLSNVSNEAGFGRSLFQRLKTLGKANHLLNIQYRMHPSISYFPNARFYQNQILDAPGVGDKSYKKHYLPWPMFGHYSFINVSARDEVEDDGHSCRNMVEVAVVQRLVRTLYKAWCGSRQKLSVGIISPYGAQVAAIQEKLGQRYEKIEGFVVKVKSVDGLQGGEEDIIILSGATGLRSNAQKTNVALTRARHCLWILGNGRTLARSESDWEALVNDAKARNCFFNADEDEELAKAILDAKKEFDQLAELLNVDSDLFQNARWKVLCSDNFRRSFGKLKSFQTQKLVLTLLLKLSKGWRPKRRKVDFNCESSSMVLKKFKVEDLYIVCSNDVQKEQRQRYTQVLRAWDFLPLEEIEGLVKRLDDIFKTYTDDFISHCNEKYLEGGLEVPKTWKASTEIVKFKILSQDIRENTSSEGVYVEKSKVSESLLLMKFYSLSSRLVNYFLSDRDGRQLELPFEVTDQELDVILFPRSCFVLGRSGTGKTTVLTMKLFEKEQLHHLATEGVGEVNKKTSNEIYRASRIASGAGGTEVTVLRQIFVTVSPLLCHAVKHHILQLKRFASGGNYSQESALQNVDDIDGAAQFMDIPNSFVDILPKEFPLVITFQKFLIMLDGTIGQSFFEKFLDARELTNWEVGKAPIFLRNFIRTREVNYEKFCSIYWPHFNDKLTKEIDSSRVFTEIMSHIKGGLRSGDSYDGRLEEEEYVNLSEGRFSTLSRYERQIIYDIFKSYEKMKRRNGEFDMADLVIDLHRRFRNERYEGGIMDFVYIDEVQDLTMRQIALFKYVCKNVREGFVFCGDTAQTIAKGTDFRFEDIRSLFYTQFVLESKSKLDANDGKKGKGQLSKCFQLSQNFRTHDGVLRLAQSVIDLLSRFFRSYVDILCPETSLIYGEAPILIEPDKEGNAAATILELFSNAVPDMVGFGAEQVILVRDDIAKNEILKYVGKQALVLTIMECKGLEFQDVLLYNFFGSSPLKSQWRVIYEYMMEQGLLDASSLFPSFKQGKHNILCSELKQLYVAITRTRQRLWICENEEEFSKPMFDYWKRMDLVQVRKLDDSFALSMQVASSPEDWKSCGYKLLRQGNYVMAAICFERAHDSYWEKLAKALGLRADADRMYSLNPERASFAWRQAAEIFYSIGKPEETADCFYMSKDYEKAGQIYLERRGESALKRAAECFILAGRFETAGQIYLEKFGESSLQKAAECFVRAGHYKTAAEVYARGNYVSKCLSVCKKGKLFDTGLQYIEHWKQHESADEKMVERSEDMDKLKQNFLESIASYYHKINDKRTMMNYVRGFNSISSIRTFLRSIKCFEELLWLEEELGHFLEAANIAKLTGEIELGADLLGKGSYFEEATTLILWFVFANTLWCARSTGGQVEQFMEKEKLLTKAKSFAMKLSNQFCGLVCLEADILCNKPRNLLSMKQYLSASRQHENTRGEVLAARMILDYHLHNISNYVRIDELVFDVESFTEGLISNNQVSIETLVYYWNFWKDRIIKILEYLDHAEIQDTSDHRRYEEFCLNYFGVCRYFNNSKNVYLLLNSNAEWLRKLAGKYVCTSQKPVSISLHQFVSAARSYWCSELVSVGQQVLTKLEVLYNISCSNSPSSFYESRSLTHIYEVASLLLKSKFLNSWSVNKDLMKFAQLSTRHFFHYIFALDWRDTLTENMISLREIGNSRNLLEEVILEKIGSKISLSYEEIGMVALLILGSGKLNNKLYGKIVKGLEWNKPWKNFIGHLQRDRGSFPVPKFHEAVQDICEAYRRDTSNCMSPICFFYVVERYLFLLSHFKGFFFTTKTTFVEWLIYQDTMPSSTSSLMASKQHLEDLPSFATEMAQEFLDNQEKTIEWIKKSRINVNEYHPLLVLRLVVIICLLHLNIGKCHNLLCSLLDKKHITELLPLDFYDALKSWVKGNCFNNLHVLAQAFQKIRNPLIVANMRKNCPISSCSDAIFVDMKANPRKEDIMRVLFPKTASPQNSTRIMEIESACFSEFNHVHFWEIVEALQQAMVDIKDERTIVSNASKLKVYLGKCIFHLNAATQGCLQTKPAGSVDYFPKEAIDALYKMKQLRTKLEPSVLKLESSISTIGALCKELHSRRVTLEPFLQQLFFSAG